MAGRAVGVVGASGGLGTSTLAARLAWLGSGPVVLVDHDTRRGTLDVVAGVDHLPGLRWGDLAGLRGAADAAAIGRRLPTAREYAVLAGSTPGVPGHIEAEVIDGFRRAGWLVVVDVGTISPVQDLSFDGLLVVAGVRVGNIADLLRRHADLPAMGAQTLVTRGARAVGALPSVVAEHLGLPLLAHVPDDVRVMRDVERGRAPGEREAAYDQALTRWLDEVEPLVASRLPVSA